MRPDAIHSCNDPSPALVTQQATEHHGRLGGPVLGTEFQVRAPCVTGPAAGGQGQGVLSFRLLKDLAL